MSESKWKKLCNQYGIEIDERWSKGVDHHTEAYKTVRDLADIDFLEYNDFFSWDVGGDGDNGECLAEQLSVLYEIKEAQLEGQYPEAMKKVRSHKKEDQTVLETALELLSK